MGAGTVALHAASACRPPMGQIVHEPSCVNNHECRRELVWKGIAATDGADTSEKMVN